MKLKILIILFFGISLRTFSQTVADIYTPACTPLYNSYYFPEYSSDRIYDLNQAYIDAYPTAEFVGNSSGQYNCHGYAWYVTEGGEKVWIGAYPGEGDPEEEFMNDGSYIEVSTESAGQKVSYRNSDHSAITTSTSGWVQSKWAAGPIMKHTPSDCPFSYSHLEYYTSVKTLNGTINSGTYTSYGELTSAGQTATSSNVFFKSGKSIKLKSGFHVKSSTFHASLISSCWPGSGSSLKSANTVENTEVSFSSDFYENSIIDEGKELVDSQLNKLLLYPNPTSNILYIDGVRDFNIKIIDCFGKQVMSVSDSDGIVDLSQLNTGIYFIHIYAQGANYVEKLIKK